MACRQIKEANWPVFPNKIHDCPMRAYAWLDVQHGRGINKNVYSLSV